MTHTPSEDRLAPFSIPGIVPVVSALVRTVVTEALGSESRVHDEALKRTEVEILKRIRVMPRYLGLPISILTVVFDWSGLVTSAKPFHSQDREQRRRLLKLWRSTPIGLFDSFVDFYEKMGTFVYFHLAEHRAGTGGGAQAGGREQEER
jgi:hypothetical protein